MSFKKTSIYVKNSFYGPGPYYTIIQYVMKIGNFNGIIYSLWPDFLYKISLKSFFRKGIGGVIRKTVLLLVMYFIIFISFIRDIYFFKPDIIVICRELFPQYMPIIFQNLYLHLLKNRNVIWTFDDNIKDGEISTREWNILCENSTKIMVTHDYLKNTLPQFCHHKVSYLPQSDGDISNEDISRYKTYREFEYSKSINILWVGTGSSLPSLSYIVESLDKAARLLKYQYGKKLTLIVVCNIPLSYDSSSISIKNIAWTRRGAIEWMSKAHIGIMPLIDNEFNRGKGGFKLIQYLTAGIPVIASNVGWNPNVVGDKAGILVDDSLNTDTWVDAIIKLSTDYDFWVRTSLAAKSHAEQKFSFEKCKKSWEELLNVG